MQTIAAPVFTFRGVPSEQLEQLVEGLVRTMKAAGYVNEEAPQDPRLVLNFLDPQNPKPYRRRAQATFVVSLLAADRVPPDPIKGWYHYLVRGLSNLLMVYVPGDGVHFVTLELGHYVEPEGPDFFERLYQRINPIACSVLVINNIYDKTLEPELWAGDSKTIALAEAGARLEELNLLPTPFSLEEVLSPTEQRHIKLLYGIGGLSYGNLSARLDDSRFWMSASGVNKAKLREIGRDILLVSDYRPEDNAMVLQVPPGVDPRRVSVDAIEHWMIYREHPEVGAIIHVHAWMSGVPSTEFNYPCGTYQLGEAVAQKVREAEDPSRAVVGLKNHGLTITGRSVGDILERIEGRLLPRVPMS